MFKYSPRVEYYAVTIPILEQYVNAYMGACIYDGEIVDQDAMGNINYGFFGRNCNIPEVVLIAGAGYAQISAGTSDLDFWITFGDDPRDCYRVIQGIDIYEQCH